MLYIVGLGLGDERGVTVRGLDAVRRCARVYMEAYAALLVLGPDPPSRLDSLEKLYGKEITVADKEMVEEERGDQALREAAGADIAFLVVGHPFGSDEPFRKAAHTDLVVRAKRMGIQVKVIDSASVVNAVGACGLQVYPAIVNNRWLGLHTLCLLGLSQSQLLDSAFLTLYQR
ncbi:probable diphthine methyl ester synthase [Miscanthus floridulus]|uniref:probable diphthine methyl ester synthase n=1 Tax=Miscanthus floridulus TaxID=154761 RepID=UPI00345906EB